MIFSDLSISSLGWFLYRELHSPPTLLEYFAGQFRFEKNHVGTIHFRIAICRECMLTEPVGWVGYISCDRICTFTPAQHTLFTWIWISHLRNPIRHVCVSVRARAYTTVNMLELKIGLPVQHRNLDVLCSQRANTRLFLLQFCVCGFYSLTFTKSPVHAATQKHSTHVLDSIRWTTLHFPYIHCKVFSVQIGTVIPREWGMWTSGGLLSCVWSLFVWATIEQDKHFKNYIDFWFGA